MPPLSSISIAERSMLWFVNLAFAAPSARAQCNTLAASLADGMGRHSATEGLSVNAARRATRAGNRTAISVMVDGDG